MKSLLVFVLLFFGSLALDDTTNKKELHCTRHEQVQCKTKNRCYSKCSDLLDDSLMECVDDTADDADSSCSEYECACRDGLLRDKGGHCVLVVQCPESKIMNSTLYEKLGLLNCSPDEVVHPCYIGKCYLRCSDLFYSVRTYACMYGGGGEPQCNLPGCVCKPGMLWDDQNKCIPTDQCPGQIVLYGNRK